MPGLVLPVGSLNVFWIFSYPDFEPTHFDSDIFFQFECVEKIHQLILY